MDFQIYCFIKCALLKQYKGHSAFSGGPNERLHAEILPTKLVTLHRQCI